ncbi:hypothetical protein CSW98_01560 [Vibrio sp. HA2012]|uniref:hypothetical protein n=1 Tax=Vibrio sp. HA2012 TaxID=1971595 RepID=UPI000C2C1155|nr:hypothetical protein [Vibrio sp. HA2012]PJC87838.1 hypothetical protein CSW98_01560 [Vibrio sp. HA2012]
MSKVAIAYIGPKPSKKDTITGSRQVFPRMTPIDVDEAVAANLLRYDQVFVKADKLKTAQALQDEAEKAKEQAEAEAKAKVEQEVFDADFTVMVAGEKYDLKKMGCPKIEALLVGADIELEPKNAQEAADDYKLRVRDALRVLEADNQE